MLSRAHLLIQKEIEEINGEPGISVIKIKENNIFELVATIKGLPQTIWENGFFQVFLKFTEDYNLIPPSVNFQTIPYHPNIDMATGRPSLDFLDEMSKWKPDYTIKHILKSLQYLLANPLLDRAVNMDAVFMLKGNPSQYESIAKQSVIATQRIRQILKQTSANSLSGSFVSLNREDTNQTIELPNETIFTSDTMTKYPLFTIKNDTNMIIKNDNEYKKWQSKEKPFKNISYDEYCKLWKGIATTKASKDEENIYLNMDLFQNPNFISQHLSISIKDLEEQVYKQLSEHKNIMYGKFDFSNKKINSTSSASTRHNALSRNTLVDKENEGGSTSDATGNNDMVIEEMNPKTIINVNTKLSYESMSSFSTDKLLNIKDSKKPEYRLTTENTTDDLFEQEVDELINWTKNI